MKAVVKNGTIELQEPMPEDWREGTELNVNRADAAALQPEAVRLSQWYAELANACAEMSPDDERILQDVIAEVRKQEKALAQKQTEFRG